MNLQTLCGRPKNKFIQLALDLPKAKLEKIQWPMIAQEKIDGVFCLAHKDPEEDRVKIYSRTGEVYSSMKHLEAALYQVMDHTNIIIFEAYAWLERENRFLEQSIVSGWARDTKTQHIELRAYCHDIITEPEFLCGGHTPYRARYENLCYQLDGTEGGCLSRAASWTPGSLEEARRYADLFISQGGEGIVLKDPHGLYNPGMRTQDIIKIKQGVSFDLEVIGIYGGKGKYADTLGGLVCKWKDGKTILISGMTDTQREHWWENPQAIIGKIVQVDAMCESSKRLLREPRFKGIRHDKTEGDF
jgi:DNA ligase-1